MYKCVYGIDDIRAWMIHVHAYIHKPFVVLGSCSGKNTTNTHITWCVVHDSGGFFPDEHTFIIIFCPVNVLFSTLSMDLFLNE